MNKENITKGKVSFKRWDGDQWPEERWSIGLSESNGKALCISPRFDYNTPESEANGKLISETFNIFTETNQTPRELMEANKELLKALKFLLYQNEHGLWLIGFNADSPVPEEIQSLIKKHSTK